MKYKLQMIAGLLFVAIIISMIAVTVGWYSAEINVNVFTDSTNVSVTTADNNYYDGSTGLECESCLVYEDGLYKKVDYKPYRGEDGIDNELYILLLSSDSPIYSILGSGYVDMCSIITPGGVTNTATYTSSNTEFRVVLLEKVNDTTYRVAPDDGDPTDEDTYQYFAVIFGNGTTPFAYSDRSYLGTSFNINIYLEN